MPRTVAMLLGPATALLAWALTRWALGDDPTATASAHTAAITAWCAVWWVLEPVPIPATSLLPAAAFPLLGVLKQPQITDAYGHKLILLFMGGFMLSKVMEKSNTHRRLALWIVRGVGAAGGRWMVLAFMIASAGLSMWISNTATVLMLLPVVVAVMHQSEDPKSLGLPLLLGVAYAASLGGLATPVGTPPNGVFLSIYEQKTGIGWGFAKWMGMVLPVTAVMLPLVWLWLCRGLRGRHPLQLPAAEPWQPAQWRTLALVSTTGALWVSRPWWAEALSVADHVHDSTVALVMVLAAFVVPSGRGDHDKLLDWETAVTIPWGILLLFGGGLAIAEAFSASGLSQHVGGIFAQLDVHPILLIGLICLCITFLTELTSNTATASILMPILFTAATSLGLAPEVLMLPAAISCSCAFMLPVATPPNAIVFSSGHVTIRQMAREGLILNLIGVAVITAWMSMRLL
ncbi:MAG: SLC13 family permease [Phycisphaeraceae bacterium]|nr:SLC13 family permease [Phycisphaeraceae bacterium]